MGTGRWRWGFVAAGSTLAVGLAVVAITLAGCGQELRVKESANVRDDAQSGAIADVGPPDEDALRATTTTKPPTTTTTRPTTTAPPPTQPPPSPQLTLAQRSLDFINRKRAENGLAALRMDADLTQVAQGWAAEMVSRQQLEHNPNLSDEVPDRFNTWGENIAYSSSADNIDQMWWESDGHRANILGEGYTSVGIVFVEDSRGITWAVQDFGG